MPCTSSLFYIFVCFSCEATDVCVCVDKNNLFLYSQHVNYLNMIFVGDAYVNALLVMLHML